MPSPYSFPHYQNSSVQQREALSSLSKFRRSISVNDDAASFSTGFDNRIHIARSDYSHIRRLAGVPRIIAKLCTLRRMCELTQLVALAEMNSFRLFLFCPASTFASSSSHSSSCDATNILYTRIHIRAHIHARMYTRIAHTNVRTTRPVFLRALSRPLFFLFCPASTFLREHSLLPFCVSPPTPLSVPFMTDLTNLENHVSRNVYQNPETSTLDTIVAWSVHGSEIVKRECTLTHRGIA